MPQMAPINWLSLFILFSIIFLMFNYMNYYSYITSYNIKSLSKKYNKKFLNWKW